MATNAIANNTGVDQILIPSTNKKDTGLNLSNQKLPQEIRHKQARLASKTIALTVALIDDPVFTQSLRLNPVGAAKFIEAATKLSNVLSVVGSSSARGGDIELERRANDNGSGVVFMFGKSPIDDDGAYQDIQPDDKTASNSHENTSGNTNSPTNNKNANMMPKNRNDDIVRTKPQTHVADLIDEDDLEDDEAQIKARMTMIDKAILNSSGADNQSPHDKDNEAGSLITNDDDLF